MLSTLPGLKQLQLESKYVSDMGIASLKELKGLEYVMVERCPGVSPDAIDKLRISRPDLEVYHILCLPE